MKKGQRMAEIGNVYRTLVEIQKGRDYTGDPDADGR
jgi:hypothetical protein